VFRPDEIEGHTFHRSAVGYNRDEVRAFLRLVAADVGSYLNAEFIDPAALVALQRQTLADMRSHHHTTLADQHDVQERLNNATEQLTQVLRRLESALPNIHSESPRCAKPAPTPEPAVVTSTESLEPDPVGPSYPRLDTDAPQRAYYRLEPGLSPGSTRHSRPLQWADWPPVGK
jgi:DivIVA domain-containing protein